MLAFDVNEFFSFGSPLSLILAYRRMLTDTGRPSSPSPQDTSDDDLTPFSCASMLWTVVQSFSRL